MSATVLNSWLKTIVPTASKKVINEATSMLLDDKESEKAIRDVLLWLEKEMGMPSSEAIEVYLTTAVGNKNFPDMNPHSYKKGLSSKSPQKILDRVIHEQIVRIGKLDSPKKLSKAVLTSNIKTVLMPNKATDFDDIARELKESDDIAKAKAFAVRKPHVIDNLRDELTVRVNNVNDVFDKSNIDISSIPPIHHVGAHGKYNYMGAGTNLVEKIKDLGHERTLGFGTKPYDVPINQLDWYSMYHDFQYISENEAVRRIADIRFLNDLRSLKATTRIEADIIWATLMIKSKNIFEDAARNTEFDSVTTKISNIVKSAGSIVISVGQNVYSISKFARGTSMPKDVLKVTLLAKSTYDTVGNIINAAGDTLYDLGTQGALIDEKDVTGFDIAPISSAYTRSMTARAISAYQNFIVSRGYYINEKTGELVSNGKESKMRREYHRYAQETYAAMVRMNKGDLEGVDYTKGVPKDVLTVITNNPARMYGHYGMFGENSAGEDNILGDFTQDMIGQEADSDPDPLDDEVQEIIKSRDAVEHIEHINDPINFLDEDERERILNAKYPEAEPDPEVEPEIKDPEPEVKDPEPEIKDPEPEVKDPEAEPEIKDDSTPIGVTESEITPQLAPTMTIEGASDLKLTEEQDKNNEKRLMDTIVMANTEYVDNKNPLKIHTYVDEAVRYYESNMLAPTNENMRNPRLNNIEFLPETETMVKKALSHQMSIKKIKLAYRQGRKKNINTGCDKFASRLGGSRSFGKVGMMTLNDITTPFTQNFVSAGIYG